MICGGELSRNIVIPNGFLEAEHAIFRANLKVYRELKRPDPIPIRKGARERDLFKMTRLTSACDIKPWPLASSVRSGAKRRARQCTSSRIPASSPSRVSGNMRPAKSSPIMPMEWV